MPKFQADVSSGDLPTNGEHFAEREGEYKIRVKYSQKVCSFDFLNFQISSWVCGNRTLKFEEFRFTLIQCMERLRKDKGIKYGKGRLAFILSKYDIDDFLRSPKIVRKRLITLNNLEEEPILYSPRALGSEMFDRIKTCYVLVQFYPGLPRHHFPGVRYIGVGYRDKGNSRDKAIDGRPDWRDAAMAHNIVSNETLKQKIFSTRFHEQLLRNESWKGLREKQKKRSRKERRQASSRLSFSD